MSTVGRKLCLLVAIALLVIGNLICGFSETPAMLYVFRSIAGIGGGGMTNLSMVIVSDVVSLEERGMCSLVICEKDDKMLMQVVKTQANGKAFSALVQLLDLQR